MEHSTDSELVELARSGDRGAFGQLVERYQQMVRRIAVGMIADEEIARDLAQEAILQAYLSLDHLRVSMRFKSWLYGITLNVCRSYVRNQRTDPLSLEAIAGGMQRDLADLLDTFAVVDPQIIAEERELHRIILNAVNHLSPGDRMATLMFYYEQLSQKEIAVILDISVGAVKGRLHRARKLLRELLAPEYAILRQTATKDRRKKMIKARINSVRINFTTRQRVVILMEETGRRALCIWIAQPEAVAIAMALKGETTARPMTAQFMANLLKAAGVQLEEVRIEALKDQIFYATTKVRNGDVVQEIDARPSDALVLALLMDSPIFIAENVMEQAGVEIPEGETIESVFSHEKGRENLLKKLEAEYEKRGMPFQKENVVQKIDALYTGKLVPFEEEPSSPVSGVREKAFQEFFERWVSKTEAAAVQEGSSEPEA